MSDETPITDIPPDRLSVDPKSPFFAPEALARGVGIMFNGAEKFNVEEYSISEGWIRMAMAKTRDRHGNALTMKLKGVVAPYFKGPAPSSDGEAAGDEAAEQAD